MRPTMGKCLIYFIIPLKIYIKNEKIHRKIPIQNPLPQPQRQRITSKIPIKSVPGQEDPHRSPYRSLQEILKARVRPKLKFRKAPLRRCQEHQCYQANRVSVLEHPLPEGKPAVRGCY